MRAVLSKTPGGPETLVVEEVLDPTPKPGEVVIEVKAVGINYPDTLIIEDKYQFRPERPFSPGAEVAGVVEAVGEGVKGVRKGDRVIAVPGWGGLVERLAVRAETVECILDRAPKMLVERRFGTRLVVEHHRLVEDREVAGLLEIGGDADDQPVRIVVEVAADVVVTLLGQRLILVVGATARQLRGREIEDAFAGPRRHHVHEAQKILV